MSYAKDREATIVQLTRDGWKLDDIRTLLTLASRLQRWAVACCNGDYPADNGERATVQCKECERSWVPGFVRTGVCRDCLTEARVEALAKHYGAVAHCGGDPRGYVVKLKLPSGAHNGWGGAEDGWCVAARES